VVVVGLAARTTVRPATSVRGVVDGLWIRSSTPAGITPRKETPPTTNTKANAIPALAA
jgi:hypothetical protein